MAFMQRLGQVLPGLLASPQFNLGIGLLAAGGPRPTGEGSGTGQRLIDALQFTSQRQAQSMELQAMRDRMMQQQRQRQAQDRMRQFVSNVPEGLLAPEQQQFLGLLSDLDPGAGAQAMAGLLGFGPQQQDRAEPGIIREARALFQPSSAPGTPLNAEAQKFVLEQRRNQGASAEQLQALELGLKKLELEGISAERAEKGEEKRIARAQFETSIKKDLRNLVRLSELNDKLENTFLATGLPLAEARRAGRAGLEGALAAAGFPRAEQLTQLDEFDEFRKLSTDFQISSVDRLPGQRVTDQQLKTLQMASVDIGNAPGANRQIIANATEALLDVADANDVSVKDREAISNLIRDLRAPRSSGQPMKFSSEAGVNAALDMGLIKRGEIVEVNGKKFRVE